MEQELWSCLVCKACAVVEIDVTAISEECVFDFVDDGSAGTTDGQCNQGSLPVRGYLGCCHPPAYLTRVLAQ